MIPVLIAIAEVLAVALARVAVKQAVKYAAKQATKQAVKQTLKTTVVKNAKEQVKKQAKKAVAKKNKLPTGNKGVCKTCANKSTKASTKPTTSGSYTIKFKSGKEYHGKGSFNRARKSADIKHKKYNDPPKKVEWKPAKNERQAFINEHKRIEKGGGINNSKNYNKINSPGKKLLNKRPEK